MSGLQMQATMIDSVSKGVKELPYTVSVVLLDSFVSPAFGRLMT